MMIYTRAYRPFVMGGSCHYHIATDVDATDPVDLGKGCVVRLVTSPSGLVRVVEAATGAIVGDSIENVRADVAKADPAVIAKQVARAREESAKAELLTAEEFWARYAKASP